MHDGPRLAQQMGVALYIPLMLVAVAIALMTGSHIVGARRERRKQAAEKDRKVHLPVLVHSINDDRCTGCDACVVVCPTNVLDLVSNKSRVLRFGDCIQCQQCMFACPTQALVMHWETEEPPPLKVPNLDPYYQTGVKGMYLIGEVAGKPLVKNAANVGRAVVEHMRREGLRAGGSARRRAEGSDSGSVAAVDVLIVGSGPGGLSAALTCIHHGLSYVILEKEQIVASTIARYPKGKEIMAEPYEARNVSFLPVFDSRKEELLPVWDRVMQATGLEVRLGEAVESIRREHEGIFAVKTTVAAYRAQRVVLATGTRGKPRTLGVPGENLPKVASLLDDPDLYAGRDALVVGGGDSAVEAACALADAGAKVTLSYRGQSLTRAQAKNRERVNEYIKRGKVKAFFGSQVIRFGSRDVVLQLAAGNQVTVANDAAFVLIGADAPVAWLEKIGVTYVERPHWYALGATDQLVESLLGKLADTPREAEQAAALVLSRAPAPPPEESIARPLPEAESGVFTSARYFDQPAERRPIPLEEFARESKKHRPSRRRRPRDAEATRLLRGLRDEGARLAHDETSVSIVNLASEDVSEVSAISGLSAISELSIAPSRPRAVGHEDPTRFNLAAAPEPDEIEELDEHDLIAEPSPRAPGPTPAIIVGLPPRRGGFVAAPTQITTPAMLDRLRRESLGGAAPDEATVQVSIEAFLPSGDARPASRRRGLEARELEPLERALEWDDEEPSIRGGRR